MLPNLTQILSFYKRVNRLKLRCYYKTDGSKPVDTSSEFNIDVSNDYAKLTMGLDMRFRAKDRNNYKTLSMPSAFAISQFEVFADTLNSYRGDNQKALPNTVKMDIYTYDNVKGNATKTSSVGGTIGVIRKEDRYVIFVDFKDFGRREFEVINPFGDIKIFKDDYEISSLKISYDRCAAYFKVAAKELVRMSNRIDRKLEKAEASLSRSAGEVGVKRFYKQNKDDAFIQ